MNALQLSIKAGHWWAEWIGDERAKVVSLFGSAILPCPYQASVPFATVAESLRQANPGYEIQPPPCAHCSPEVAAAFGLDKLAQVAPHLVKIDLPNS